MTKMILAITRYAQSDLNLLGCDMDFKNERLEHKGMTYKRGLHGNIFFLSCEQWFKSEMKKSDFFKLLIAQKEELFSEEARYLKKQINKVNTTDNEKKEFGELLGFKDFTLDTEIGFLTAMQRGAKLEEDRRVEIKKEVTKRW